MLLDVVIWVGYIGLFIFLARKGRGYDAVLTGAVGFFVQSFAYVATYISAVALVGFGGLAYKYGMQMMLVAFGNVLFGTWIVYKVLAWPTRELQKNLQARTPAHLLSLGHNAPKLRCFLGIIFALFLSVYASAVIKGAAVMLTSILPIPVWALIWLVAILVGVAVWWGGLRGVLYTEAMQGCVMLVGIIILIVSVLSKVGGPIAGIEALAALPPTNLANNGFTSISFGEQGFFIFSLVLVTSFAVWAQPQMIQRHFALSSKREIKHSAPLASIVILILVGGMYFISALSRLFLPEIANPDDVVAHLVDMLLPEAGKQLFILAIVSASLSTTTALYHIAISSLTEDIRSKQTSRRAWFLGIVFCIIVSSSAAQIKGQLIALLCTTSWSVIGATAMVPYLALVIFKSSHAKAAWASTVTGFVTCIAWYLLVYPQTALISSPITGLTAQLPPFLIGLVCSIIAYLVVKKVKA